MSVNEPYKVHDNPVRNQALTPSDARRIEHQTTLPWYRVGFPSREPRLRQ